MPEETNKILLQNALSDIANRLQTLAQQANYISASGQASSFELIWLFDLYATLSAQTRILLKEYVSGDTELTEGIAHRLFLIELEALLQRNQIKT